MSTITRKQFRTQLQQGVSLKDTSLQSELNQLGIQSKDLEKIDGPKGDGVLKGQKELNALFDLVDRRIDHNKSRNSISSTNKAGKAYTAMKSSIHRQKPISMNQFSKDYDTWCDGVLPTQQDNPQAVSSWMAKQYGLTATQQQQAQKALQYISLTQGTHKARVYGFGRIAELARSNKLQWIHKKLAPSVIETAIHQQVLSPRNADAVQQLVLNKKFGAWTHPEKEKSLLYLAGRRGKVANRLLEDKAFRKAPMDESRRIVNAFVQSPKLCEKQSKIASGVKDAQTSTIQQDLQSIKAYLGKTGSIPDDANYSRKIADKLAEKPWLWSAMDKTTLRKTGQLLLQQFGLNSSYAEKGKVEREAIQNIHIALSSLKEDNPLIYKSIVGGSLVALGIQDSKDLWTPPRNGTITEVASRVFAKSRILSKIPGSLGASLVQFGADIYDGQNTTTALRNAYIAGIVGAIGSIAGGPVAMLGTVPLEVAANLGKSKRVKNALKQLLEHPDLKP